MSSINVLPAALPTHAKPGPLSPPLLELLLPLPDPLLLAPLLELLPPPDPLPDPEVPLEPPLPLPLLLLDIPPSLLPLSEFEQATPHANAVPETTATAAEISFLDMERSPFRD